MPKPSDEYDPKKFPPFAVTVDIVVLIISDGALHVQLVRRDQPPFRGELALPGGFVHPDEAIDTCARRKLKEETGLRASDWRLVQLPIAGGPDRDPRMRVVSVPFLSLVAQLPKAKAGRRVSDVELVAVSDVLAGTVDLAFDHAAIVEAAVEKAGELLESTSAALAFVDEPFTIPDLRRVYEAVWGAELHAANFRRKVLSVDDFVEPTGEETSTGRGVTDLFNKGSARTLSPPLRRPSS